MNTTYMVELAVLIAIILIMAFTPIGYIRTLGLEITLIVVPVAVGAVTLGPMAGLILGTIFGITSFIQCFGMSAFGVMLLSINPVFTFIVCVPTRMLMGWLTGLIFQGLRKGSATKKIACPVSCLASPLLNTLFFMGAICILFYQTDYIQSLVTSFGASTHWPSSSPLSALTVWWRLWLPSSQEPPSPRLCWLSCGAARNNRERKE